MPRIVTTVNLFPIVSRELLVASRRFGTYASRFAIALLIFLVVGYMLILVAVDNYSPHVAGRDMFYTVSCIMIFLCNIAGVYLTADCLSEEKRNGTLGLLFLTNLRGYQVVMGKMSVGAIQGLLGLMAAVPMLVVPILMGGVDPALVLRMTGVMFATLFLSLSVGLACSAMFKSSKVTTSATFGAMFLLNFATPIITAIVYEMDRGLGQMIEWIPSFSTGAMFALTLDSGVGAGGPRVAAFNISLWMTLGVTGVSMLYALWKTGRAWQDQAARPAADTVVSGNAEGIRRRTRVLNRNPLEWLTVRRRLGPLLMWIALLLVFSFMMFITGGFNSLGSGRGYDEVSFLFSLWVTAVMFKWWMAGAVCDRFRVDRGENAMELLLSTPLEYGDYAQAIRRRLKWQFMWPVIFMLCLIPFMMAESDGDTWPVYIMGVLMFGVDAWAAYFVGMHASLTMRRPTFSSTIVILKIHVLPYAFFFGAMLMIAINSANFDPEGILTLWFMIGLVNNSIWVGRACLALGENFRKTAAASISPGS